MSDDRKDCRSKIEKFLNEVDKRYYFPAMANRQAAGTVLQNFDLSGKGITETYQDLKHLEKRNRR